MKSIVLVYVIGFLLWCGLLWFDSWLQIPFAMVVVTGFFWSIVIAVKKLRYRKKLSERLIVLAPLLIEVLSVAIFFLPLVDYKVKVDHALFTNQRLEFIENIRQRQPPVSGAVKLPHWWLSEDGEAYVYRSDDKLLVGFWVKRGMLSPSWTVVYTELDIPPVAKDLHGDEIKDCIKLSPHWYYLHVY
jgi:hypothetical protein